MCTFLDRNISIIRLYATITLLLFLSYSYSGLMSHYSPNQVPGHNVYASAPSFGLQQINDSLNDLLLIQGNNSGNNNDTQIRKTFHSDLHEIDYFSDGKTLNATFWLFRDNSSQIQQMQQQLSSQLPSKISLRFGVLIDVDSNSQTGFRGADYDSYIEFSNGNWTRYLYQISTMGIFKLIDVEHLNQSSFRVNSNYAGLGFVSIDTNLRLLNYPEKYQVLFYYSESDDQSASSSYYVDFGSWADIPPPELELITSPKALVLTQG
jgi:hypothetical protein